MDNYKKTVKNLKPYKEEQYKNVIQDQLAIFTMDLLEKKGIPLYFEYIGVALFKLFPKKFALITFKEFPDLYRISNMLRLHLRPSDRNWAVGNIKTNFSITPLGREFAKETERLLNNPECQKNIRTKKDEAKRIKSIQGDVDEILDSSLFKKWRENKKEENKEEISEFEILSFLGVMSFTKMDVIQKRISRLRDICKNTKNSEAAVFINDIAKSLNLK